MAPKKQFKLSTCVLTLHRSHLLVQSIPVYCSSQNVIERLICSFATWRNIRGLYKWITILCFDFSRTWELWCSTKNCWLHLSCAPACLHRQIVIGCCILPRVGPRLCESRQSRQKPWRVWKWGKENSAAKKSVLANLAPEDNIIDVGR